MKRKLLYLLAIASTTLSLSSCKQNPEPALAYSALRFETPSLSVDMAGADQQLSINYLNANYAPPTSNHALGTPEAIVIDQQKTTAVYGQHFTIDRYDATAKSVNAPYDNNGRGIITITLIEANITSQITIALRPWCDMPQPTLQTQLITVNPAK